MSPSKKRVLLGAGALGIAIGLLSGSAIAAPPAEPAPAIAGWSELVDAIRDLPAKMFAKLSPEQRADPQVQQEIGRLALSALASSAIDTLGSDPEHPVFIPQLGQVLTTGQPNADTVYRGARIAAGGTYRLRGRKGSLRMVRVAEAPPMPHEPGGAGLKPGPRPDHDFNALHADAKGDYDVILSPARPRGYTGDWWQSQPGTVRLLLRMVSSDWGVEQEPTFSIERLDGPAPRPRPAAALLEQRLRALPSLMNFTGPLFVDHVAKLRADGFVNKVKVVDMSKGGGLAGQFYYEGAYDLKDDEALIVETKLPAHCRYRSLIATNDIYETTDWYNNISSLNDSQARADADGVLRIVVSARDPGVPNWLDTAGYRTGAIQGRWADCDSQPVPNLRKVAIGDVRAALPAATPVVKPAERDRTLRDRRAALQHRPLW